VIVAISASFAPRRLRRTRDPAKHDGPESRLRSLGISSAISLRAFHVLVGIREVVHIDRNLASVSNSRFTSIGPARSSSRAKISEWCAVRSALLRHSAETTGDIVSVAGHIGNSASCGEAHARAVTQATSHAAVSVPCIPAAQLLFEGPTTRATQSAEYQITPPHFPNDADPFQSPRILFSHLSVPSAAYGFRRLWPVGKSVAREIGERGVGGERGSATHTLTHRT